MINLCDDCKTCPDNNLSLSYCFNVCSVPMDILKNVEIIRNTVEQEEKK